MKDAEAQDKRNALDSELVEAEPGAGIAMGKELFAAFARRGWLTMEDFTAFGQGVFPEKVPAYNRLHFVFVSLDVPDTEFRVGPV